MPKARVVLASNCLCGYPEGGGVWTVFLQYILGLRSLGYDTQFLEIARATEDREHDDALATMFFERMRAHGVDNQCTILRTPKGVSFTMENVEVLGKSRAELQGLVESADLLWNICGALPEPMLSSFRRKAFVDLDPGHLQVSALSHNLGFEAYDALLTIGGKIHDPDCEVPTLGFNWRRFLPFVYIPMWKPDFEPRRASFTSVTQWTWGELWLGERVLSIAKREAYLRFLALPKLANSPFELAANLHHPNPALEADKELLTANGWNIVDPHRVAGSPEAYRRYILASKAEIGCPKPIFRELKTGWVSDRSACYLASGRPVLAEDTGFSDLLPTGNGLLAFTDMDEALAGVAEIGANYSRHSRAARELAVEYMSSEKVIEQMMAACF
jgi:hypothetical protein